MKLQELLSAINIKNGPIIDNPDITTIAYHSQKVEADGLFVCIRGYKTDGHRYLKDAVQQGAVAAIVEEIQEGVLIPQILVENSRKALATLAHVFYQKPSQKMKMIGITATNGKTSTSYMVDAILNKEFFRTGLIGTVSIKYADKVIPSTLTTPESLDLHHYFNEMVKEDVSHITMEVSSSSLELNRVYGIEYDIVTLNNISLEHIDSHGSFERYFEVKSSLIRNASESSSAILNLDDEHAASLTNKTKANVITFGIENQNGDIRCKDLDLSSGRAKFTVEVVNSIKTNDLQIDPQEFQIELAVPGLHSVYNALVAIIVGLINGVAPAVIQETLKNFKGVDRRFEFIYEDNYKIIDDHFANPGNINVTMQTIEFMDYDNLHILYAIRGQRGPEINKENAEVLAKWLHKLNIKEIDVTKSINHTTERDKVTDEEAEAFLTVMKEENIKVNVFDELPDATEAALQQAEKDDVVLLAGCQGMDAAKDIVYSQLNL
jgi:UDP-N-acetylmuramoyl-L-alanyl-D-glutamate--2,6-diaminopimelate ligase